MSFIIKQAVSTFTGTRQIPKADTQIGVIQQLIDLGIQTSPYGDKHKVMITFELPDDLIEEGDNKGKPLVISKEYPVSLGEAKSGRKADLRLLIEAAEGRPLSKEEVSKFDLENILGKGVYLTIMHKPKKSNPSEMSAVIASAIKTPKSVTIPKLINKAIVFTLSNPDKEVFGQLHDWIKKKINLTGIELDAGSADY
jgi:hypothetical protein